LLLSAGTKIALGIWKERSSTILQLLHMGFGVGALTGPLLCAPFLAVIQQTDQGAVTMVTKSRVHIAFFLFGFITVLISVPFYFFYFTKDKRMKKDSDAENCNILDKRRTWIDNINPASYANGNLLFGTSVFILLFAYFFLLLGGEKTFASLIRTISVDVFNLDKNEASYLNSTFWLSLTAGRFIGSFVSHFVETKQMLLVTTILNALSSTLCYMYGLTSRKYLWGFTILEGVLIAPLYPLGVAYVNSLIEISGFCLMLITFSGSFGDMLFIWTAGRVYDTKGAPGIFALTSAAFVMLCACVILFQCCSRRFANYRKL